MADITLKLIWYKLCESYTKMAEAGAGWFARLTWEDHVLDILLFGWIVQCLMVYVVVSALHTFVGPLQRRPTSAGDAYKEGGGGALAERTIVCPTYHVEQCNWLNTALNWGYLHYYYRPEWVDQWVSALNEQVAKLGGPVQIKFESVQTGSLPPKFSDVGSEANPDDQFIIHIKVESRDLAFSVFASQQAHDGVRLTNCTATVVRMKGSLKIQAYKEGIDIKLNVAFDGRPDIKIEVKPTNPYQDPYDMVDLGVVEEAVRHTICLTSATFIITPWFYPRTFGSFSREGRSAAAMSQLQAIQTAAAESNLEYRAPQTHGSQSAQTITVPSSTKKAAAPTVPSQTAPQTKANFEPIQAEKYQSAFYSPVSASTPPKPPRYVGDKRLLVKIIKANGLGPKDVGKAPTSVDPAVLILMDDPIQNHSTTVVRNATHPFWDESFLFDITQNSNELRFEVFDKSKHPGEDFLGENTVYIEDLRKTPSSRQILSLQSRPGNPDYINGSLTVEFLFMDSAEAEMMFDLSNMSSIPNNQFSPKRRGDTAVRQTTPGGTVVTGPASDRLHNSQLEPGYNEKRYNRYSPDLDGSDSLSAGRSSPYQGTREDRSISASTVNKSKQNGEMIVINGVESVAETAIRELMDKSRRPRTPTKKSMLIITGVKREPVVPIIKTIESSPTEEQTDSPLSSHSTPPSIGHPPEKDKKKSSFGEAIRKRFGRKKRSQSADRAASSLKERSNYLRPPDEPYGHKSKDDLDLVRRSSPPKSPNLKKSRSLGGSLKKLFRRSRRRSKSRGEESRDSSLSRGSGRNQSQGPSRDSSLNRQSAQNRGSSVS
ncbi:phospholipid transfer protein C2CD2L-like isoform X3 [Gigantopelta aegis]|uniref:phospholipid transfer protein C2CD2L-like isoform X3 n=1 Tax=Gigantopelta aegis TaxID=1735272 RepID=UPI001B8896A8|nr:phospholipid transfer protein C2CD2L-like isoform X3 [Gigantopelta aegis]